MELVAPVEIAAGTYTLDLYGYSVTGRSPGAVLETSDANGRRQRPARPGLNGADAALTITDSYPGGHGGAQRRHRRRGGDQQAQ